MRGACGEFPPDGRRRSDPGSPRPPSWKMLGDPEEQTTAGATERNGVRPRVVFGSVGLCPGKAAEGAVCIDLFIKANWIWGFKGDGRGHDPNAPASRSRAQIIITPGSDHAVYTVDQSCNFAYCAKARSDNVVSVSQGRDGAYVVGFRLKDAAAPFGMAPDLDGLILLTPDGNGGFTTSGDVAAFPSSDIYQRRNGAWVPIRAPHDETTPLDLLDFGRRHRW